LLVATLIFGAEIKGARRWLVIARRRRPGVRVHQAGVRGADRLAVRRIGARPEMPANTVALGLLLLRSCAAGAAAGFRPDHAGRAGLGRAVLHGRHALIWVFGAAAGRALGLFAAYLTVPHVARAHRALPRSGLGRYLPHRHGAGILRARRLVRPGPGEGTVKRILPESHTDFVFAVAAEEFGIVCA
jgi:cell division protein FtsW